MSTQKDYSSIIFSPEDVGILGSKYLEERRSNNGMGVKVGLRDLDEHLLPLFPGELMSVIARPGNGKTGFMVYWARTRAAWLRSKNITNRVVVYITLEQSIEELNAFNVAADNRLSITNMAKGDITDDEWVVCLKHAINRRFVPLWNIGYSSMTDRKQIKIDADAIEGAIKIIAESNIIDMVYVDYLQRMPTDSRSDSKTIGVSDNLDALKTISQQTSRSPMVVGVQAKREVDQTEDKIPGLDDGQWTSNIEQTSDKILSLMRPSNYFTDGDMVGKTRIIGKRQMLISLIKQKLGPANIPVWAYFDPEYNKLDELEIEHA